jgi:cell division protein FtsZ
VLHSGVRGVTDLMVQPGLINLDFADIRTVMAEMGKAMMGTGEAEGERRSISAAEAAISNPLLDDISMKGAKGVLINITGGLDMTLYEVDEATNRIRDEVDPDANIIFGSTFDETMEGRVRVSVVATGIDMAVNAQGTRPQTYGTTSLPSGDRARQQQPAPAQQPTAPARPAPVMPQRFVGQAQPAQKPAAPAVEQPVAAAPVEAAIEDEYAPMTEAEEAEAAAAEMPEPEMVPQQVAARAPAQAMAAPARPGFLAPRPVQAAPRQAVPQRPVEAAPVAAPAEAGRKKLGLFRRVTGLLREEEQPQEMHHAQPTLRQEPAPRAEPQRAPAPAAEAPRPVAQQRLAIDAGRAPLPRSEEDALDIPAFLRRQAN